MFGKLLWVAVLAGSALAQVIIKHPVRGADVAAGAAFTIQLGIPVRATSEPFIFFSPPPLARVLTDRH